MDSNRGPLLSEATALPTESQPGCPPTKCYLMSIFKLAPLTTFTWQL